MGTGPSGPGRQSWVAGDDDVGMTLPPPVDRQAVPPDADVEAPFADRIRRHLAQEDHACVGVCRKDQPVQPVEPPCPAGRVETVPRACPSAANKPSLEPVTLPAGERKTQPRDRARGAMGRRGDGSPMSHATFSERPGLRTGNPTHVGVAGGTFGVELRWCPLMTILWDVERQLGQRHRHPGRRQQRTG